MMRRLVLLLCLVLAMPAAALAASDIVATYTYTDGAMVTICARDAKHVRMDSSPTSYTLLADGKVYSVNCEEGQCQVYDLGAMSAGMSGGMTSMFGGGDSDPDYEVRYEKTGKTETVAGYKGTVYNAVIFENGKVFRRDEMVMSSHADIKKLTEAWMAMSEALTQSMGQSFQDSLNEAKKMGYGGILRYGNEMRLARLSKKNLDASYYKLPKNAHMVQMQQPTQQDDDMGLGDDAKEIGQDAKDSTKDEIKSSIRNAISDIFN
ncbi:hypothetical protein LF599_00570 [Pseudodesulfovibrio thermohalotolerans]|uniref:hypothetical protein n=1 Tax=Pseudodesulfovibrio thermohalotolerans TaxID=2880651 RepID=UPI002442E710|nr:hypothetical protein [Pseudodesulfovibrio thermohalotolerans]WFS62683.1 hypothetical protein LF599_00570 [Pseudodesulfovibrio thermohalotolerans]